MFLASRKNDKNTPYVEIDFLVVVLVEQRHTNTTSSITEILANTSSDGPLKVKIYTRLRHSILGRSFMW